jgi:parvulin-like peptidyl-prolyl isomerase
VAAKPAWKVNGWLIRSAEVRAEAAALRQGAELSVEERLALAETALENLIERAMLRTSAHRLGFTPTEQEVEAALARLAPRNDGVAGCRAGMASAENLEDIRQRLAVDKMMHSTLDKVKRPQAWQVAEFYRKNSDRFWTPALAHVWHLVKNCDETAGESEARAAVEQMRTRVQNGEDFATVAQDASDCRELGGDLGYFAAGTMVAEFDEVVFSAPIGELTPVFRTRFGFHTAIVKDRKPAGIRALEEVELEIEAMLLRQAQDAACGELFAKLRKSAKIEQVTE